MYTFGVLQVTQLMGGKLFTTESRVILLNNALKKLTFDISFKIVQVE